MVPFCFFTLSSGSGVLNIPAIMVCPEKWTLGRLKSGSRLGVKCTKTFLQVLELVVVAAILVVVLTVVAAARVDTIVVVEMVKTAKSYWQW